MCRRVDNVWQCTKLNWKFWSQFIIVCEFVHCRENVACACLRVKSMRLSLKMLLRQIEYRFPHTHTHIISSNTQCTSIHTRIHADCVTIAKSSSVIFNHHHLHYIRGALRISPEMTPAEWWCATVQLHSCMCVWYICFTSIRQIAFGK